ncbi:CIA30 family protein-like protein [Xylariomycetidae sp. FL0641]|nr:CIA30 family protein-like protein [Xylariomycetidae sp. FL0641]
MEAVQPYLYLFGNVMPWNVDSWVASDDRVRGGKSQSYLTYRDQSDTAFFHGDLDITALGGAGFASQRSPDSSHWDLSNYASLRIKVKESDGKKYTLTLKDEILPKRPDGREQSTISWEYDFVGREAEFDIPWSDFKPTYRGKAKPDAKPLDRASIKRISIMMRSFFGEQQGPFKMELEYIAAIRGQEDGWSDSSSQLEKQTPAPKRFTWLDCFRGLF